MFSDMKILTVRLQLQLNNQIQPPLAAAVAQIYQIYQLLANQIIQNAYQPYHRWEDQYLRELMVQMNDRTN